MGKLCLLVSCLLLSVGAVTPQTGGPSPDRLLPQWLTGIIAVVGFLFLSFVGLLVKKAWCEEPSRRKSVESVRENDVIMMNGDTYDTSLDMVRSKDEQKRAEQNVYDNLAMEQIEDKATAM
ncbi:PDZK1-interacting protein 1 [Centropristis striata]|uniref:PDZK1-interacting protein 1 n=1 Tax=Centropristis striata TaxID=184440 RepID=UPI0027E0EA1D|nr:PDZK1-interacting protein 1 [Centropristis striata]